MTDSEKHIIASGKYSWTRRVLRIVKDPVAAQCTVEEFRSLLRDCMDVPPHIAAIVGITLVQRVLTPCKDEKFRAEIANAPEFKALHEMCSKYLR